MNAGRIAAACALGVLSGCVPGGGAGFGPAGRASSDLPEPQLAGWEIQELVSGGSAYIEWTDAYVDCGYFYPNGNFESYGYFLERDGLLYDDGHYEGSWYVTGNQLCIDQACYYAEWREGEMWLQFDDATYAGYMTIWDGPNEFYQYGCGIG